MSSWSSPISSDHAPSLIQTVTLYFYVPENVAEKVLMSTVMMRM